MPWGTNTASSGGTNPLQRVLDILGSKGGQVVTSAIGAGLSAYGAGKEADANRALSAGQFKANLGQRQLEDADQSQLQRASSAAAASPLGDLQNFAQRNAIIGSLLGGARNVSITPGDSAVASAMGNRTGGIQLPQGGLDPSMIDRLFGDGATQASIAQRQKAVGQINPRAPMLDLGSLYGNSADGSENAFTTDVKSSNASELQRQMDEEAKQRAIIQAALDEDVNHKKQGGGNIFGKILGGAMKIAPLAIGLL